MILLITSQLLRASYCAGSGPSAYIERSSNNTSVPYITLFSFFNNERGHGHREIVE